MFVFVFGGEKQKVSQKMEIPTIALQKVGSHFSFKKAWHLSGEKTWRNSWTSENVSGYQNMQLPKNCPFS